MTTEPTISTIAFTRFKSLVSESVELRPLTVLTGENSAGKSSVIQALRLLAQATRSIISVRSSGSQELFLFSGSEFNAGTWDDLISDHSSEQDGPQTIGLALAVNESDGSHAVWGIELARGEFTQGAQVTSMELGYFRGERSDLIQLQTRDGQTRSHARHGTEDDAWRRSKLFELGAGRMRLRGGRRFSNDAAGVEGESPRFTGMAFSNSRRLTGEPPWKFAVGTVSRSPMFPPLQVEPAKREPFTLQAEIALAESRSGFDPSLFVVEDGSTLLVKDWLRRLSPPNRLRMQMMPPSESDAEESFDAPESLQLPSNFEQEVANGFRAWVDRVSSQDASASADSEPFLDIQEDDLEPAVAKALASLPELNPRSDVANRMRHGLMRPGRGLGVGPEELPDVVKYLEDTLDEKDRLLVFTLDEYSPESRAFVRQIDRSSSLVSSVLTDRVHYLGPLRTASTLYSSTVPTGLVATIGPSGEYTAAILDAEKDTTVVCPLPKGGTTDMPLVEAVGIWLAEFGVAAKAETTHLGKTGVRISFADAKTEMLRDPTELGVGASQLLPVIVLCLLAKPGDVVMIEQPELHLHPRPQQILGDFLIAVARSGRQIIAETHSDHVVNRIRRRVAEDQDDEVRKLARVHFAQRVTNDDHGSETTFTPLDVNEFGAFDDWPAGFFDEARDDLAVIARVAAKRARDLIDNGGGSQP